MTDDLYQPITVTDIAAIALNRDLDRTVIILGDDEIITAGQLRDSISRYAQALNILTPRPRRAALLSKNRPEVPGVFYALSFAPIVSTALHPMGSIDDYLYVIEDAEIDLLIYDDTFEDKAAELKAARAGAEALRRDRQGTVLATPLEELAEPFQPGSWSRPRSIPKPCAHRLFGRHHRQAQGHHDHAPQRDDLLPDLADRVGMAERTASPGLRAAEPCRGGDAASGAAQARHAWWCCPASTRSASWKRCRSTASPPR